MAHRGCGAPLVISNGGPHGQSAISGHSIYSPFPSSGSSTDILQRVAADHGGLTSGQRGSSDGGVEADMEVLTGCGPGSFDRRQKRELRQAAAIGLHVRSDLMRERGRGREI